jgi:hypothetical protein
MSKSALTLTLPSFQVDQGLFLQEMRPGYEADHHLHVVLRLKMCGVIPLLTHMCLHGIVLNEIQGQLDLLTRAVIFVASCLVPEVQFSEFLLNLRNAWQFLIEYTIYISFGMSSLVYILL